MAAEIGVPGDAVPSLDRERLEAFIRRELPGADEVALSEISLASGGVSREHFSFDLRWSQGGRRHEWPLILIRDGDRPGQTDRGAEFRLLRALEPTGIPAPRPYWCDARGRWLDRPFIVMERVGGAVTPPFQVPYPESPALRQRLTERFVDVLCELHLVDWRGRGIDFLETPTCATEELAGVAARLFRAGVEKSGVVNPDPTLERAMRWCIERAPSTRRWTLCHGDYKPDNVLHADGEILAVIDWERARIGDPLADLGYVCAPHLRVGNLVSGLAEQEAVLERYAARTGFEVEPHAIRFWQVLLLLQTYLYFAALRADAARKGRALGPQVELLMKHLLHLVDQTLG
jgi:aminoglycoside phosphotransferase (APT) family kinase protein